MASAKQRNVAKVVEVSRQPDTRVLAGNHAYAQPKPVGSVVRLGHLPQPAQQALSTYLNVQQQALKQQKDDEIRQMVGIDVYA